jgi:hypothetical protein
MANYGKKRKISEILQSVGWCTAVYGSVIYTMEVKYHERVNSRFIKGVWIYGTPDPVTRKRGMKNGINKYSILKVG